MFGGYGQTDGPPNVTIKQEPVSPGRNLLTEASFDSGYCTSPVKHQNGSLSGLPSYDVRISPARDPDLSTQINCLQQTMAFSPFKGSLGMSPLKTELSPMKSNILSPFKAPGFQATDMSIGDDWDKEFFPFEDSLFSLNDNLSDNTIEELLKSPEGKAFLKKNGSPVPKRDSGAIGATKSCVKKLKISPLKDTSFVSGKVGTPASVTMVSTATIATTPVTMFKSGDQTFLIKQEPMEMAETKHANVLAMMDPNKLGATPIKPSFINIDKMPKRKLAMKLPSTIITVPNQQKENVTPKIWPSKERLQFARAQFQSILANAVEKEKEKRAEIHRIKLEIEADEKRKAEEKAKRQQKSKDKYPQLKKALAKPTKSALKNPSRSALRRKGYIPKKKVKFDPSWLPEDDGYVEIENGDDEEEEGIWDGPVPFSRQSSYGYGYKASSCGSDRDDDSDLDELWEPSGRKMHKKSGFKVVVKKRRR